MFLPYVNSLHTLCIFQENVTFTDKSSVVEAQIKWTICWMSVFCFYRKPQSPQPQSSITSTRVFNIRLHCLILFGHLCFYFYFFYLKLFKQTLFLSPIGEFLERFPLPAIKAISWLIAHTNRKGNGSVILCWAYFLLWENSKKTIKKNNYIFCKINK